MQISFLPAAAVATGLLVASGAHAAAFRGEAKLAAPVTATVTTTVNGVDWTCTGDTCLGAAPRVTSLDGFMRECRKVATALGPLTAYASRGRVMSRQSVESCNKTSR